MFNTTLTSKLNAITLNFTKTIKELEELAGKADDSIATTDSKIVELERETRV